MRLNKIKIVLTGASGMPYKFEAKIKRKTNASPFLQKLKKIVSTGTKFHKADKNVCPSIICDIINASGFNAANEHSAEINQS